MKTSKDTIIKGIALNLLICAILGSILLLVSLIVRSVEAVKFDINCAQYIKRAADASTIEIAKEELEKAISYAEKKGLTDGCTCIFWHEPAYDVGFWYTNLTSALEELENLSSDATALEKSNVLMKLRESLTEQGEFGL